MRANLHAQMKQVLREGNEWGQQRKLLLAAAGQQLVEGCIAASCAFGKRPYVYT